MVFSINLDYVAMQSIAVSGGMGTPKMGSVPPRWKYTPSKRGGGTLLIIFINYM